MEDTVSNIVDQSPEPTAHVRDRSVTMVLATTVVVAVAVSMAAFATRQASVGVSAASVALLMSGVTLSWLSAEARRLRDAQRMAR